MTFNIFSF